MSSDISSQQEGLSLWKPVSPEAIRAGLERVQASQPTSIMLTLVMKLRATRFKEDILKQTQQRITSMKSEVLATFRHDLEQISTGQTDQHVIEAIVEIVAVWAAHEGLRSVAVEQMRQHMKLLRGQLTDVAFMNMLIKAIATADDRDMNHGLGLLRRYLEYWHTQHPDRNLEKTLEAVREAKKLSSKRQSSDEDHDEPRYTAEELACIKFAILLRKALGEEHTARMQLLRAVALAEIAEQQAEDVSLVQHINQTLHKRCGGQTNQRMITTISDAVIRSTAPKDLNVNMLKHLHDALDPYVVALQQAHRRVRRSKYPTKSSEPYLPLTRYIIHLLATLSERSSADDAINWLRGHIEQWYQVHPSKGIEAALTEAAQQRSSDELSRFRYALLLRTYLEATCTISTDILVLAELAEITARRLGDGTELLSGLLSRCYGESCSLFKYPLSAVLRESVFFDCGAMLLGWCQLVVDYKAERDKKISMSRPPQQSGQPKIFCRLYLFRGQRVARIVLLYRIWSVEDRAYRSAAARIVPVGPDVGRTLGNPDLQRPYHRKRGQRTTRRRRSTILGPGSIGKKGARRLKKWLLPYQVAVTTLRSVEILLHSTLYTDQEVQDAKSTPHPWRKDHKLRRGIKRTRPTQYRETRQQRPLYLWQLSKQDRLKLRNQLREQITHIEQFKAIKADIDLFLEPAPPTYPQIVPPLLTEAEIKQLSLTTHHLSGESREVRQERYFQGLDWFYDVRPSRDKQDAKDNGDTFAAKLYDVETMAARNLEQVAAELRSSNPQPIWFKRTMNANLEPKAFTLLFFKTTWHEHETHRYVFLCELAGVNAAERASLRFRDHHDGHESLCFVNFPQQQFDRPKETSLAFFSTEIGDQYQGRILRDLIERQRQAYKCISGCDFKETGKHLPSCAPEAAITTARIVEQPGSMRHVDWYVHLPVPIPVPSCTTYPNAVIGFHEHKGTYYFAVIDLAGKIINVGEVKGPDNIGPRTKKGTTNDNFAFEIAWAMLGQSRTKQYTAYMGVEDTGWKRNEMSIIAEENKEKFAFPRERILEIATYKAALSGMFVPIPVQYVAPMHDCGCCGYRTADERVVHWHAVQCCFHCQTLGLHHTLASIKTVDGAQQMKCRRCQRIWAGKEPQFRCPRCGCKQYARYNTAIVVARRTLESLIVDEHVLDQGEDKVLPD